MRVLAEGQRSMSTLVYRYDDGDGHYPLVSPDGNLVAWGNKQLRVISVENPSDIWSIGEGKDIRFIGDDILTWVNILSATTARRFVGTHSGKQSFPTFDDERLVAGNDFEASRGSWASVLIETRRLAVNNREWFLGVRAVRMCGSYMLTIEQRGAHEVFAVYFDGQFQREHALPANANRFRISELGWITFGYYGLCGLITPEGGIYDITVTPWLQEHVARIVHLPDGNVWAWNATVTPNGNPLVLGRPLRFNTELRRWYSDATCVQLPFPAELVDAVFKNGNFIVAGSANLGTVTPLEVHRVNENHPRAILERIEPEPEPEPEEPEVNNPGIDVFDFAKTIERGKDALIVHWKDRNNPGVESKVRIVNGSLKIETTYDGWQTKTDKTERSRPVNVKC
jgi:hypothetical protein